MDSRDLGKFAEELRGDGVDAKPDAVYGPGATQPGLWVAQHFYPLWELNAHENEVLLLARDFNAIRARRGPGWTAARPATKGK